MRKLTILFIFLLIQMLSAMPPYKLTAVRGGYQIQLTVPDIVLKEIPVNERLKDGTLMNETFVKVSIPGFAGKGAFGDPELLTSSIQLALENDNIAVEVSNVIQKQIVLKHKIYPAQPVTYDSHMPEYFYYNENVYAKRGTINSYYVKLSDKYTYRGQNAASIEFNPVQYDPAKNILTVAKSFTIAFKTATPTLVRSIGSRAFDKIMRSMFQNLRGELGRKIPSESLSSREKYLVIASSSYKDNSDLQRFVEFRSGMYEVEFVSSSDVGSSKDDYKDYIRERMPTFCLLVGGYPDFPTHSVSSHKSYTYYVSSATSDPKPDIALGLFFVRSASSLTNIVNKTISAETNLVNYPDHFVAFGGNTQQMGNLPPNHCDVIVREMYDDYFVPMGEWEITELYQVNQPRGGKDECIAAMNKGVRFINYNGHGMSTGWSYGNGTWRTTDIGSVTNTIYPFVLSCACATGNYTSGGESWAEKWIGHENLGAAFIGSQTTSYTSMHGLNRGVFRAIVEEEITKFGLAFMNAVSYTYDTVSGAETVAWQFHYFGDPAVETMASPPFLTLTSPNGGEIWEQGRSFDIVWSTNIDDNVKVELLKGGSVEEVLAASIPPQGPYTWEVADDFPLGTDYKIRVTCVVQDTLTDESDDFFEIEEKSQLTLKTPNGGEYIEKESEVEITWEDNLSGFVKIDLFKGGSFCYNIVESVESNGSYKWNVPKDDIKSGSDYRIRVYSVDKDWLYDESDADISIQNPMITEFPYIQDFDDFVVGGVAFRDYWEQLDGEDIDWTVWAGKTPSKEDDQGAATGPDNDHTSGSGNYLYVESSSPNNPDKKADIITPMFDFHYVTSAELSFWYHMFSDNEGADEMGDLYLDINVDGTWQNDVVHLEKDHGDEWFEETIDMKDYLGSERIQFRFRAVTGSGWASDVCIDDFKIEAATGIATDKIVPLSFNLRAYNSRIYYQIPELDGKEQRHVSLKLYNLQGKLIRTLVDGSVKSGYHFVRLDRQNSTGQEIAAGVYLCRIETEGFNKTINMLLRK